MNVVRSLIIVHESKVGKLERTYRPLDTSKLNEIKLRLENADVENKIVNGPSSYNAIYGSFWICVWSQRYKSAYSWNLQGLTFDGKFREPFVEYFESGNDSNYLPENINWAINMRGLEKKDVILPVQKFN